MPRPGVPSFEQLTVFIAVVERGSFAAAGRQLRRATSAVSYAITNLEQQLGVQLFDRDRTRRPVLTEAGTAVLSEARSVSVGVENLRAKVKGLLDGVEGQIGLAVDVMLPTARLVDAMQAFEAKFPTVTLRLYVEALGAVTQLVHSGIADIGISGVDATLPGRADQSGWGGSGSCRSAEPPVGGWDARTGGGTGLCAARAQRPLDLDRGSRLFGDRCQDVAPGGPGHQARVAAGWHRLGQHARTDGPRRPCRGASETTGPLGVDRRFLRLSCDLPHGRAARAGGRVDSATLCPASRIRDRTGGGMNQTSDVPRQFRRGGARPVGALLHTTI
jgi:DNA-binding transcriptional LysR family regulator